MPAMNKAANDLVGSQAMQELFRKLCHRNSIRRQIGRPPIDVPTVFHRIVLMKAKRRYEALLEPCLVEAFTGADWPDGFTPRLLLAVKLHRAAVDRLLKQGTTDPRVRRVDMLKLIERLAPHQ